MRESVVIYTSIDEVLQELDNDTKGRLFQTIIDYQLGKDIELDKDIKVLFIPIRQQIDRCNEKYEETKLKRSKAGKKGMESRWKNNKVITNDNNVKSVNNKDNNVKSVITSDNKNNLYVNVNDNVNDNVNVNVDVNKKKSGKKKSVAFQPPTLAEVQAYSFEKNLNIDAERFIDHYISNGWMVGKTKMKDWKATARNWARRDKEDNKVAHNSAEEKLMRLARFGEEESNAG